MEKIDRSELSIQQAANLAHVSNASIRNWVKTGYLTQIKKGFVDKDSFENFMKEVVGKDKLVLRANKLFKDKHNHIKLSDSVKNKIHGKDWLVISQEYEHSLSNAYRNKEGIYYTPSEIVIDMFRDIKIDSNTTFLDPCCGSGNFIIEAIKKGIKPQNIVGFDVDPNAIEISKKRIFEITNYNSKNIIKCDYLKEAHVLQQKKKHFDLIFTNPPWGKKLNKQEKEKFSTLYGAGKSLDTTSLFFFASIKLLKKSGRLGFLVQEALFNVSTFQDTRKKILDYIILRLIDYDKPFKGLLTKAKAFILEKTSREAKTTISCQCKLATFNRDKKSFINNPKQILNFWITHEETKVIDKLFSLPYITLKKKAIWALGIVTGNNSKFCKSSPREGYIPVFKGSDITSNGFKEPSKYIPEDFSKYQQVAPISVYQTKKKLVYRFISSKLIFYCDTDRRYILNSANLLIPDESLAISCQQLAIIFNSELMNWLFQSLFKTYKILRSDLEELPIHNEYFNANKHFSESNFLEYLGITKENNKTYKIQ